MSSFRPALTVGASSEANAAAEARAEASDSLPPSKPEGLSRVTMPAAATTRRAHVVVIHNKSKRPFTAAIDPGGVGPGGRCCYVRNGDGLEGPYGTPATLWRKRRL